MKILLQDEIWRLNFFNDHNSNCADLNLESKKKKKSRKCIFTLLISDGLRWLKRDAYNLMIGANGARASKRNESFRNYENQDVVMVIAVKPCRHVDTPEVWDTGEMRRNRRAQKVKTLWKSRQLKMAPS